MSYLAFGIPPEERKGEYSTRYSLALEVNEAIMKTFCNESEEKLTLLIKFMLRSQKKDELEVPKLKNMLTGEFN